MSRSSWLRSEVLAGLLGVVSHAAAGMAAPAANWHLQHWGSENGLSHNTIYALLQDRQGFLWVGTVDGLDRFDGYDFVHYRHDPTDPSSLGNQIVRSLLEDRAGRLWVGTDNGISRLDRADGRFVTYPLGNGPSAAKLVWRLYEDRGGRIWAGSDNGLFRYDAGEDRFVEQPIVSRGAEAATYVWNLEEDSTGALWAIVASSEGLRAALHPVQADGSSAAPFPLSDPSIPAGSLIFDRDGRLWLGPDRPAVVDHEHRRIVAAASTTAPQVVVTTLFEDRSGSLWFGTEGSGVFEQGPGETARQHWLRAGGGWFKNAVRAVYQDRAGAIWLGTYAGLERFDPAAKPFACLSHDDADPTSLSSSAVSALWEDPDGMVWIGTFGGGLDRLDRALGTIVHHRARAGDRTRLRNDVVWAVRGDAHGRLWTATDAGLCRLDPVSGRFSWIELPGISPRFRKLLALGWEPPNRLWIGSPSGVHAIDVESSAIDHYALRQETADPLTAWVDSLLPDGRGGVWLGTGFLGLRLRHLSGPPPGRVEEYPLRSSQGKQLTAEGVWMIHRDRHGRLWAATGVGLSRLDPESGSIIQFYERDGLPAAIVYGILEDGQGRLWLSTDRGLSLFDERLPMGRQFRNFDRTDGLCGNEFNRGAALRGRDGTFYFGGVDGLTVFDPASIHDDPTVPPVVLTGLEVASREGPRTINPHGLQALDLSWRDSSFTLSFAALSFGHSEKNRYAYWLEGLDPAWVDAGQRRFARYTSVPPGNYVFHVRGSNPDGVWNLAGLELPIVVTPPFWQRLWFRGVVAALLAVALYAAYRARVRHLVALERLRLSVASDLHDDLSSDLAGIAMVTDLMRQRPSLTADERSQLGELRDRALQMVDAVRDTVWYVNPEHDSLEALVRRMRRASQDLLAAIPHSFTSDIGESARPIGMAQRRGLFLIYKELLHNIARHARASRVEVSLASSGGVVTLRVTDDGIGFDPAAASEGLGLRSLRRRAEEIGAELRLDSAAGQGTRAELRIEVAKTRDGGRRRRVMR